MLHVAIALGAALAANDPAAGTPVGPESDAEHAAPVVLRVGGDLNATVEKRGENYYAGSAAITTPLPVGYPPPTPPGAIDIKSYPAVRRAQVTRDGDTWWGMDGAFWPLFRHIQRHDIEMTSPVEMDYQGLSSTSKEKPEEWTMSFLYRTAELGPTGKDRSVEVVDMPPITVVALAYQGNYGVPLVKVHLRTLELWLESQNEWERAGEPRSFFYNGPEAREKNRWAEVQIPIKKIEPAIDPASAPSSSDAPGEPTSR